MAKKKNKKDKKGSASPDPVEAVRAAVERTFHATTEGAAGTQKRTRQLVDEVAHAAARIRETIEDLRVLDEVKGLRNEVEALARRVAALETTAAKPATTASRSTRSTSRAKPSGTTRARTTGAKSSSAKPAASRKPRTTGSSAAGSRSPESSGGASG